jgi:hypothetical protein
MTQSGTFRESLQGGWLNALAPGLALGITIVGEEASVPEWMTSLVILCIWFTGFFVLIRVQFKRRHSNADVFKAFWTTTTLGFILFAAVLLPMYFIR